MERGRSYRRGYTRLGFAVVLAVVALLVYRHGGIDLAREMVRAAHEPLPPPEGPPAAPSDAAKKSAALVKLMREKAAGNRQVQEVRKSMARALQDFAM